MNDTAHHHSAAHGYGSDHAGNADRQAPEAPALRIDLSPLRWILPAFTVVVIALGILREIVIRQIGKETILQDLRHIALDAEMCLGAWWESLLMLCSALLLYLIAERSRAIAPGNTFRWRLLAVIFVYMSLDEMTGIHEVFIAPLNSKFGFSGALTFSWVIPGSVLVAAFGLYYLRFLFNIPRHLATGMVVAGSIFVGGALGMEFVGGYLVSQYGFESPVYLAAAITEESMEMIGMTVFVLVLSRYLVDSLSASARRTGQDMLNVTASGQWSLALGRAQPMRG